MKHAYLTEWADKAAIQNGKDILLETDAWNCLAIVLWCICLISMLKIVQAEWGSCWHPNFLAQLPNYGNVILLQTNIIYQVLEYDWVNDLVDVVDVVDCLTGWLAG